MGISSPRGVRAILLSFAVGGLVACGTSPPPRDETVTATPPAARHPIETTAPVRRQTGTGFETLETGVRRDPNTRSSRQPRPGDRVERSLPEPAVLPETRTYPPAKVRTHDFDAVPKGTIDTRPGTIRPPYLEIPGR